MDNYNPWDRQNASISIIPCANNQQDSWTLLISLNLLKSPSNKNEAHRWERRETSFWNVGFPIGKTKITDSANDATKERWAQPPDSSGPVSIALKLQHPYRGLGDIEQQATHYPIFRHAHVLAALKKITLERWTGSKGKQGEQVQAISSGKDHPMAQKGAPRKYIGVEVVSTVSTCFNPLKNILQWGSSQI